MKKLQEIQNKIKWEKYCSNDFWKTSFAACSLNKIFKELQYTIKDSDYYEFLTVTKPFLPFYDLLLFYHTQKETIKYKILTKFLTNNLDLWTEETSIVAFQTVIRFCFIPESIIESIFDKVQTKLPQSYTHYSDAFNVFHNFSSVVKYHPCLSERFLKKFQNYIYIEDVLLNHNLKCSEKFIQDNWKQIESRQLFFQLSRYINTRKHAFSDEFFKSHILDFLPRYWLCDLDKRRLSKEIKRLINEKLEND